MNSTRDSNLKKEEERLRISRILVGRGGTHHGPVWLLTEGRDTIRKRGAGLSRLIEVVCKVVRNGAPAVESDQQSKNGIESFEVAQEQHTGKESLCSY